MKLFQPQVKMFQSLKENIARFCLCLLPWQWRRLAFAALPPRCSSIGLSSSIRLSRSVACPHHGSRPRPQPPPPSPLSALHSVASRVDAPISQQATVQLPPHHFSSSKCRKGDPDLCLVDGCPVHIHIL
uniref:Uncharacterized protein n=1 Tax=Arundo donax TaxID=35708 RepID=A0A0A9CK47_ARUDO